MDLKSARYVSLLVAACLSVAPISTMANTRASDGRTNYVAAASNQPGLQRAAEGEDEASWLFGFDLEALLIGTGALTLSLVTVLGGGSTDDRGFQSNGAN